MSAAELAALKARWNDVLFNLESQSRVAWLLYFDARLVSFEDGVLTIDFSDPQRFDQEQTYPINTDVRHRNALLAAVTAVTGQVITLRIA
jgi:hypothetical protein